MSKPESILSIIEQNSKAPSVYFIVQNTRVSDLIHTPMRNKIERIKYKRVNIEIQKDELINQKNQHIHLYNVFADLVSRL